jgi:hypothetical protein
MTNGTQRVLINQTTCLIIQPTLAKCVGRAESAILQQIHFWMTSGSVASVKHAHHYEQDERIPDILGHQICKIVERRLASRLTEDLSFLNHANVFNA